MFAIEITDINATFDVVYYESRKGELKTKLINMRIGAMKDSKTKVEESTRLAYTGLHHSCCQTY